MRNWVIALAISISVVGGSTAVANAATIYELEASGTGVDFGLGPIISFSLIFEDEDADELFKLDELVSFSGLPLGSVEFTQIDRVPDIMGVTIGTGGHWYFSGPTSESILDKDYWTYSKTAVVPLPASLPLMLAGLGGLGLLARRKKKRA